MDIFFDEKPKRIAIPKNIRHLVWQKYNLNSLEGKCCVCNRPITHDNFDIGHEKAVANGGKNNISNLKPICRPCNSGMGTMSIEKFKRKYFGIEEKAEPISQATKMKGMETKKSLKQIEKPISKKELLNGLSEAKLIKIAKKLDLYEDYSTFFMNKEEPLRTIILFKCQS